MTIADLGSLGATGNSGNNQVTTTLIITNSVLTGDLVIVCVACDNRVAGGGDDAAISGVTLGGVTLSLARQNASNLAAQAGASCSLWWAVANVDVASGSTVTAVTTSAATSDATGVTARRFSIGKSSQISVASTNALANDAADPGALVATTTNAEHLRVRAIAGEASAALGGLTVTAGWTDWADGDSAATGTAAECAVRCESIITTSTTGVSDPTWGTCDNASVYVAFRELVRTPRHPIDQRLHNVIVQ